MASEHILIVDDERAIQKALRGVLEDEGYRVSVAGSAQEALDASPGREPGPGLPRHLDAGGGRARGPRGVQAAPSGNGGGDDLRPRHHRDRREGHQARRLRLHREAPLAREDPAGRDASAGPRTARARESRPARAARARAADRRQEPGHRGAAPADRHRSADQRPRADPRRERRRQGAGGARHPRPVGAAGRALRRGELRGHPRGADRVRAVRPRAGRVHRAP